MPSSAAARRRGRRAFLRRSRTTKRRCRAAVRAARAALLARRAVHLLCSGAALRCISVHAYLLCAVDLALNASTRLLTEAVLQKELLAGAGTVVYAGDATSTLDM